MSQNLPKRSLGDVLSLRHPNHFVFAGANNRNVIITYWFLAAPVQANRDFFYIDCMTAYFNCKYIAATRVPPRDFAFCGGNKALYSISCVDVSVIKPRTDMISIWWQLLWNSRKCDTSWREIFLECYCVAREEPTRRQETKPQAATVSSLRLGGLLACPDLPCDWSLRDKQS